MHAGGYRLSVTPEAIIDEPAEPLRDDSPFATLSLATFVRRLTPTERGGGLEHHSLLLIHSRHPIESLPQYAHLVLDNIIDANVHYVFLIPVDSFESIVALVGMIPQGIERHFAAQGERTAPVTRHALFSKIANNLSVVLIPFPCVDSLYILNATNEHTAVAYCYLSHQRCAIQLKDGSTASNHARDLLKAGREGREGIIQFASGVDRSAVQEDLRAAFQERLGIQHEELIEALLPGARQGVLEFPKSTTGNR